MTKHIFFFFFVKFVFKNTKFYIGSLKYKIADKFNTDFYSHDKKKTDI